MKVAVIGRTEILYKTAREILNAGFEIPLIITAKASPEYTKTEQDFEILAAEIGAVFLKTGQISSDENIKKIRISIIFLYICVMLSLIFS